MNGSKFIFDTNFLLLYYQGKLKTQNINFDIEELGISIITKIEYLINPLVSVNYIHLFEEPLSNIKVYFLTPDDDAIFTETIKIRKNINKNWLMQ